MRTKIPKHSYWDGTGKHEAVYTKLHKEIPREGECPKDRPALEKLRVAGNCYHDLFNNGLCNRANEFGDVFGFVPEGHEDSSIDMDNEQMISRVERTMDKIIEQAATEAYLLCTR